MGALIEAGGFYHPSVRWSSELAVIVRPIPGYWRFRPSGRFAFRFDPLIKEGYKVDLTPVDEHPSAFDA